MKNSRFRSLQVFFIVFLLLAVNTVCFFHFVPLAHASTTTTFDVVSDAYDGEILGVATALGNPAYYVLRDRADGNSTSTTNIEWGQSMGDPFWQIWRGFIRFDTSTFQSDWSVTSAKICLYGSIEGSDLDFYIRIQKWTDGDDGIATDDFSKWDNVSYDDGNFYSTAFVVNEWNNITLSNFAVIVKAGYTDICIRSSMDINGEIPSDDFETAEDTGAGTHPPKLEITYTEGNVAAEDYVDSQTNVDSSSDQGTHSSFTAQKATDWTNDSLIEANTNTTALNNAENFVDANSSDIDTHTGHGTSSNFTAQQDANILYNDTLTEADTAGAVTNTTMLNDGFEAIGAAWDDNFDGNGATPWDQATSSTYGSTWMPHGGTYMAAADSTDDGALTTDNLDMSTATAIYISFWYMDDDVDTADYWYLNFYNGASYIFILDLNAVASEDIWYRYNVKITDSQYFKSNFRVQFSAGSPDSGEVCFVDESEQGQQWAR